RSALLTNFARDYDHSIANAANSRAMSEGLRWNGSTGCSFGPAGRGREFSMAEMTVIADRVLNPVLAQRVMSAEEAAALIQPGCQIGMSGFTGSGYPKAVPMALARRVADAHLRGEKFKVNVFTGAST